MQTDAINDTPAHSAVAAPAARKRGRPFKTAHPAPSAGPSFTDEQFQQLIAVLAANKSEGIDKDALTQILQQTADVSAKAMQKAMKPENPDHPGKSALSYPEGDAKKPRPVLPYELWWNSYPMHMFPETEHWRELELACQLTPGEYRILRKDGTPLVVSVTAERDADQRITRLDVRFAETREDKWMTPPKMVTLYQMVYAGKPGKQAFLEGMTEYFALVFGSQQATA